MKKIKVGDVFFVTRDDGNRYFQYLGNDSSQLGGNIIAAFSGAHTDALFEINRIDELSIEFYALTSLALGVKMGLWALLGNAAVVKHGPILFRDTNDYGKPGVVTSDDWWVWEPNAKPRHVGPLVDKFRNSFIGVVSSPTNISDRLKTGKYSHYYPPPAGGGAYLE